MIIYFYIYFNRTALCLRLIYRMFFVVMWPFLSLIPGWTCLSRWSGRRSRVTDYGHSYISLVYLQVTRWIFIARLLSSPHLVRLSSKIEFKFAYSINVLFVLKVGRNLHMGEIGTTDLQRICSRLRSGQLGVIYSYWQQRRVDRQ